MSKQHGTNSAYTAVIIRDDYQGKGLGTDLFRRALEVARDEGLKRVHCNMLAEDQEMHHICKKLGFVVTETNEKLAHGEITL